MDVRGGKIMTKAPVVLSVIVTSGAIKNAMCEFLSYIVCW